MAKRENSLLIPALVIGLVSLLVIVVIGSGIAIFSSSLNDDIETSGASDSADASGLVASKTNSNSNNQTFDGEKSRSSNASQDSYEDDSSNSGGSLLGTLLPGKPKDKVAESDRMLAEQFFNQQPSFEEVKNIQWTSKPLYIPIYGNPLDSAVSHGPLSMSRTDALAGLKIANDKHRKMYLEIAGLAPEPLEIKEMKRVGTAFFVSGEGKVGEKAVEFEQRIDVSYDGISISKDTDASGRISVEILLTGKKQARFISTNAR